MWTERSDPRVGDQLTAQPGLVASRWNDTPWGATKVTVSTTGAELSLRKTVAGSSPASTNACPARNVCDVQSAEYSFPVPSATAITARPGWLCQPVVPPGAMVTVTTE